MSIINIFNKINEFDTNIGRGSGQKAYILSYYLIAMFNLNYKVIYSLNIFNCISKKIYLFYTEKKSNS